MPVTGKAGRHVIPIQDKGRAELQFRIVNRIVGSPEPSHHPPGSKWASCEMKSTEPAMPIMNIWTGIFTSTPLGNVFTPFVPAYTVFNQPCPQGKPEKPPKPKEEPKPPKPHAPPQPPRPGQPL
jgi:hypothetical protein